MLTISFKLSPDQDHDNSIKLNLICEGVPARMVPDLEFEFTGANLSVSPAKIALKDIFDPAIKGAVVPVSAIPQSAGEACITMNTTYKGQPFGSVTRSFDI